MSRVLYIVISLLVGKKVHESIYQNRRNLILLFDMTRPQACSNYVVTYTCKVQCLHFFRVFEYAKGHLNLALSLYQQARSFIYATQGGRDQVDLVRYITFKGTF